jgi:hypothetical protein
MFNLTNVFGMLIFFTTRQSDYCKILKFDLHIGYQKEFSDFWDQRVINLFEWLPQ